ncbi:insulinase family protein [Planctomycetota bacterium]
MRPSREVTLSTSADVRPPHLESSSRRAPSRRAARPHRLKVLLVSDPDTNRGAAALTVAAGSRDDGAQPGLAHFLEHMLFLGTGKYPDPGEYKDYLAENDGFSNAYTAFDHTNYHFEVAVGALEGALDRFARFFIDPLMTDDLSERELNAVDSEHQKNLEDDFWRTRQVYRSLLNEKHPGNKKTLEGVKNARLREFYESHYSANTMHLSVIGNQSLDTLEKWARGKFSDIEDRSQEPMTIGEELFHDGVGGHRLNVKTLRDVRELALRFELAEEDFDHEAKPSGPIAAVLGHEGPESLLQWLKSEGLATALSAGAYPVARQGTFDVRITLTKDGLKRAPFVVERVFGMINYLRGLDGLPAYVTEEHQRMGEIELRFRQPNKPLDEARMLAAAMVRYPHERLLETMYLTPKPDPKKVARVLAKLTPENALVTIAAKNRKVTDKERYYGTEYNLKPFSQGFLDRIGKAGLVGAMGLPPQNPFIPSDFELVQPEHAEKPWIHSFDYGQIWLRHDVRFKKPKAALRVQILNNKHSRSVRDFVLGQLFVAAVTEALNPFGYPMTQAGLKTELISGRRGITIDASGYSHKIPELMHFLFPFLTEVKIDEKKFEILRDAKIRAIKNKAFQPASRRVFEMFWEIAQKVHYNDEAKLAAYEQVTFDDLKEYAGRVFQEIAVWGVVYGNLSRGQVEAVAEDLLTTLKPKRPLPDTECFYPSVLRLKKGTSVYLRREIKSNDSAVALIYQHDRLADDTRAAMQVLGQILPNRFYQDLRTLQQTGYIVSAGCTEIEELPIFYFLSQSSVIGVSSLRGRFQAFLKHLVDDLGELDEEEFEKSRQAALAEVRRQRTSFEEEMSWNYHAIFALFGDFDSEDRMAQALEKLNQETFVATCRSFFAEDNARRVSVEVVGSTSRHQFQPATLEEIREDADGYWRRPRPASQAPTPEAEPATPEPVGAGEKQ